MSANFVEELVFEYYRLKGYLVVPNYWFPSITTRNRVQRGAKQSYSARSWSDIDVLAVGERELLIIQVKSIINQRKVAEKVIEFFAKTKVFIEAGLAPDQKTSIHWWHSEREIKNILIYESYSPPSYIDQVKNANIEVHPFSEYFVEIVSYINSKSGCKEENPLMRMIHFLVSSELLIEKNG